MADPLATTAELRLLAETIERMAAGDSPAAALAQLGLFALPFFEDEGGMRARGSTDIRALAVPCRAFGSQVRHAPQLIEAVLAGPLLRHSSHPAKPVLLTALASGEIRIATALLEPKGRSDPFHGAATARRDGDGWVLEGVKTMVLGGGEADRIIVLVRTAPAHFGAFLIDPQAENVEVRPYLLRDGTAAADVTLGGCRVGGDACLALGEQARAAVMEALAQVRLALGAEAAGIVRAVLRRSIAYTAERHQFGSPLGAFQVIQHRLAEMAMAASQADALVAAMALDCGDAAAIARGHAAVARLGMASAKSAIQLHGGYGMTEDLPLGQALRRMMTIALLLPAS